MPNMEKVIKSLEICVNDSNVCGKLCEQCQYESDYHKHCHEILMTDALELLKEQDERIKNLEHQLETITRWRANAGAFD